MDDHLLLNFRFSVSFLAWGGRNNTVDTRFQSVSGIGAEATTVEIAEGGQNLYTQRLPERISHRTLVLQRGRVIRSTLNRKFEEALSRFEFGTSDVLVTLLGEDRSALAAWMFHRAYPTRWSTADLSARSPDVLIDTMELTYTRMQSLRI